MPHHLISDHLKSDLKKVQILNIYRFWMVGYQSPSVHAKSKCFKSLVLNGSVLWCGPQSWSQTFKNGTATYKKKMATILVCFWMVKQLRFWMPFEYRTIQHPEKSKPKGQFITKQFIRSQEMYFTICFTISQKKAIKFMYVHSFAEKFVVNGIMIRI